MKLADLHQCSPDQDADGRIHRVLGGGVVPGAPVLIGGDPWDWEIDPSTQVSTQLSQVGTVLYVSGEESAQQIKLRAERLGDIDSEFYLYAETNMQSVWAEVERNPSLNFLIIDSIQTIGASRNFSPGPSQVREVTAELMQLAKTSNIAIFIVGSCDLRK